MRLIRYTAAASVALGFGPALAIAQFSFTDLTNAFSSANLVGISPDGTTLLGQSPDISGFGQPLYYRNGQITYLPILTYGNGIARRMAPDGTIVGGVLRGHDEGLDDAGVWRNNQISLNEHEPGGLTTDAKDISANGRVIVGSSDSATHGYLPTRWVDGHVEPLGDIPGGPFDLGEALAENADGSVIVGYGDGYRRAFRWQNGTTEALPLIDPNGDIVTSRAVDVSADGHRIIGVQTHSGALLTDGILWEDGTPRVLPNLPGARSLYLTAISADGSLVFGDSPSFGSSAVVWDDVNGTQDLLQILLRAGVDLRGWTRLEEIRDVSADGHTILGYGFNAQGVYAPFVATIPEPSTLSLAAAAFVLFGLRRGQGR